MHLHVFYRTFGNKNVPKSTEIESIWFRSEAYFNLGSFFEIVSYVVSSGRHRMRRAGDCFAPEIPELFFLNEKQQKTNALQFCFLWPFCEHVTRTRRLGRWIFTMGFFRCVTNCLNLDPRPHVSYTEKWRVFFMEFWNPTTEISKIFSLGYPVGHFNPKINWGERKKNNGNHHLPWAFRLHVVISTFLFPFSSSTSKNTQKKYHLFLSTIKIHRI